MKNSFLLISITKFNDLFSMIYELVYLHLDKEDSKLFLHLINNVLLYLVIQLSMLKMKYFVILLFLILF